MAKSDATADETQVQVLWGILAQIRLVNDKQSTEISRLVHAAESVLARLPVENERKG